MIGDIEGAIDAARLAAEAMPDSPNAVRQYTEVLRSFGRLDEALPVAEQLVRLSRADKFESQVILAMIESGRGEYQRAIDLLTPYRDRLEQESRASPSPGLSTLAVAFAGIGRPVEAQAIFLMRARTGGPAWQRVAVIAAFNLPDEYIENGRPWIALVTDPSLAAPRANALLKLARFSGQRTDASKAMGLYRQFGSADGEPNSPDWLWVAARAAKLSGSQDEAEALHRQLLEMAPDELVVSASLADSLARQPARTDEALALIESATAGADAEQLEQLKAFFAITKARALLTAGRPNEAVAILDPLVKSEDSTPAAVVLLANACLNQGNRERATDLVDQLANSVGLDARTASELRAIIEDLGP
jgi:predicted Zn-dependent protease